MLEVVLEVEDAPAVWRSLGSVAEVEPPGSISSNDPTGRQVYLFGWYDNGVGVWRSHGGFDAETPVVREITTTGFDRLADLTEGPYEMDWFVPNYGRQRARFRLNDADAS
jgi:hypothetical protein